MYGSLPNVIAIRQQQQIEIFVRLDQLVDHSIVLYGGTLLSIVPCANSRCPFRFLANNWFAWLS